MIKSTMSKEYEDMRKENMTDKIENGVYMKEELIITDVNNQLGIPNNANVTLNESNSTNEEDDIIIISEEIKNVGTNRNRKISQHTKELLKKNMIVPAILKQMVSLKSQIVKGKKVPKFSFFIKRCRLCKLVQDEYRSKSMIKCKQCDSKCFLFQCLMCFKKHTTITDMYHHIDKKHASHVCNVQKRQTTVMQQKKEPKGIKVKSNKCLETYEKFQLCNNGYTQKSVEKTINQPSGQVIQEFETVLLKTEEDKEDIDLPKSPIDFNSINNAVASDEHANSSSSPVQSNHVYQCNFCNYSDIVKYNLSQHIMMCHTRLNEENSLACSRCGKQFKHRQDVKTHERFCGKKPHLKCHMKDLVTSGKLDEQTPIIGTSISTEVQFIDSQPNTASKNSNSTTSVYEQAEEKAYLKKVIQVLIF